MLAILLLCLVIGFGLLSLGGMVWFVVLRMEEGWGRPTVLTVVLAKRLISVASGRAWLEMKRAQHLKRAYVSQSR